MDYDQIQFDMRDRGGGRSRQDASLFLREPLVFGLSPLGARVRNAGSDVGLPEVFAFVKKRLASRDRQCIRKAVTEVEPCRVASLAKPAESQPRQVALLKIDGGYLDVSPIDEQVQIAEALGAEARFEDD
jgi:hypothetical protein